MGAHPSSSGGKDGRGTLRKQLPVAPPSQHPGLTGEPPPPPPSSCRVRAFQHASGSPSSQACVSSTVLRRVRKRGVGVAEALVCARRSAARHARRVGPRLRGLSGRRCLTQGIPCASYRPKSGGGSTQVRPIPRVSIRRGSPSGFRCAQTHPRCTPSTTRARRAAARRSRHPAPPDCTPEGVDFTRAAAVRQVTARHKWQNERLHEGIAAEKYCMAGGHLLSWGWGEFLHRRSPPRIVQGPGRFEARGLFQPFDSKAVDLLIAPCGASPTANAACACPAARRRPAWRLPGRAWTGAPPRRRPRRTRRPRRWPAAATST